MDVNSSVCALKQVAHGLLAGVISFQIVFFSPHIVANEESSESISRTHGNLEKWMEEVIPEKLREISPNSFEQISQDPESIDFLQSTFLEPYKVVIEKIQLLELLVKRLNELESQLGQQELERRIQSKLKMENVEVHIPQVGKAELIYLKGSQKYVPRITHFGTHLSYYYLDANGVSPEDPDLIKYADKQLFLGSQTNVEVYRGKAVDQLQGSLDTKEYGREGAFIFVDPDLGKTVRENQERPDNMFLRFKKWLSANYVSPTKADVVGGISSGGLQAILGTFISLGLDASGMQEFNMSLATLSLIYGTVIGIWNPFYRNIIYSGSKRSQTMKHWFISLSFSYILMSLLDPSTLWSLSLEGAIMHSWIWFNNLLNNWARIHWNQFARYRDQIGISKKTLKIGNYDTKWSQATAEAQLTYSGQYVLKSTDLLLGGDVPILVISIPVVHSFSVAYAKYLAAKHPENPELQKLKRVESEEFKKTIYARIFNLDKIVNELVSLKVLNEEMKEKLSYKEEMEKVESLDEAELANKDIHRLQDLHDRLLYGNSHPKSKLLFKEMFGKLLPSLLFAGALHAHDIDRVQSILDTNVPIHEAVQELVINRESEPKVTCSKVFP